MGDFNARTARLNDFIRYDDDKYGAESLNSGYITDTNLCRTSHDKISNKDGKLLVDICLANDCRILNGRTIGDLMGRFTSFQPKGCSIVDYMIASKNLMENILFFRVSNANEYSDHAILTSKLSCQVTNKSDDSGARHKPRRRNPSKAERACKFIWSDEKTELFKDSIAKSLANSDLNEFLSSDNPDTHCDNLVQDLNRVFYSAAKDSLESKSYPLNDEVLYSKSDVKSNTYRKWFDADCSRLLRDFKNSKNAFNRDQGNPYIRGKYFKAYKEYRKAIKSKKKSFNKNLLSELSNLKSGKEFWKKFKELKSEAQGSPKNAISNSVLRDHYENLFKNDNKENGQDIHTNLETLEKEVAPSYLDNVITREEVEEAIDLLKKGKASGIDGILPEMIINSKDGLMDVYVKLFNQILSKGQYPKAWKIGELSSIYKRCGSKYDPNNYRGITVTSTLSKLFCSITNSRLEKFAIEKKLIPEEQIAFASNSRTSDHIFTLYSIVNKYLVGSGNYVYSCFVDFSKAFDNVPHDILFSKLLKCGIGGQFYNVIKSMYSDAVSIIKNDPTNPENFIKVEKGVHQGNVLSPLLFKIFIADLPRIFDNINSDPVCIGSKYISSLLFADDLVILSRSQNGLQTCLDSLNAYCNTNGTVVNIKKTKSITFNKRGRTINDYIYKIGSQFVENVNNYKYLGVIIQASGKFNEAAKDLKARALKASHSLRSIIPLNSDVTNQIDLYHSIIKPVLLYGSELWYPCLLSTKNLESATDGYFKFDREIELFHINYMKKILGVHTQASNLAVLGELGEFPMYTYALQRCLKFWLHIVQQPIGSLVKNAYNELYNLDQLGNLNWLSFVRKLLVESSNIRLAQLWENQGMAKYSKYKVENLTHLIEELCRETFCNKWSDLVKQENAKTQNFEKVNWVQKNKLRTYCKFKENLGLENYLTLKMNVNHRKALTNMRISAHDLHIETGRYCNIPPESRKCSFCISDIETEEHALLRCPTYDSARTSFFQKSLYNNDSTFKEIMSSDDPEVLKPLAKFCFDIFRTRSNSISILNLKYPIYFLSVAFYFYFNDM